MPSPTTERSVVEVLRAAKERITPIEQWTQRVLARAKPAGPKVSPIRPEASCWCAIGSLAAETRVGMLRWEAERWLSTAASEQHPRSESPITYVNDNGARAEAHRRTLQMFDRAIELAEAEQT